MADGIWEFYAKEYQTREARWEPVRSGVPYTCNECPALIEMRAARDRWELTVTSTAKHYKELLEKVSAERDYWQQLAEERADG